MLQGEHVFTGTIAGPGKYLAWVTDPARFSSEVWSRSGGCLGSGMSLPLQVEQEVCTWLEGRKLRHATQEAAGKKCRCSFGAMPLLQGDVLYFACFAGVAGSLWPSNAIKCDAELLFLANQRYDSHTLTYLTCSCSLVQGCDGWPSHSVRAAGGADRGCCARGRH